MLFECCCCFNDISLNEAIVCPDNHISCSSCINKALEIAVGENKVIKCFHTSGCKYEFSEVGLNRALPPPKIKTTYDNIVTLKNVSGSGIQNFYACPFCNNGIINDSGEAFDTFYCYNCNEYSCVKCKEARHSGPCNKDRRAEEEATERAILICVCNAKLLRGDGCNHLKCSQCRTQWCWICKKMLQGDRTTQYAHFKSTFYKKTGDCFTYGERPIDQVFQERPTVYKRRAITQVEQQEVILGDPCRPTPIPIPIRPLPTTKQSKQKINQVQPTRPTTKQVKTRQVPARKKSKIRCNGVAITSKEQCKRYGINNTTYCRYHTK